MGGQECSTGENFAHLYFALSLARARRWALAWLKNSNEDTRKGAATTIFSGSCRDLKRKNSELQDVLEASDR
jgi:hypothetical protein